MQDLNICLVQTQLSWEDAEANRTHLDVLLSQTKGEDLIVLPEMFNSGFSMNTHAIGEEMDGLTIQWMKEKAQKLNATLIGSLVIKVGERYYNRLICMSPEGITGHYDKRHLFRMAEEEKYFSAGNKRLIVSQGQWQICPMVCYDLRFPVWTRNRGDYHCLIFIANWPEPRASAWEALLKARAIENQCYVVGVNRVGKDGKGINYSGDSLIFDAKGKELGRGAKGEEQLIAAHLSGEELLSFREKFPVHLDADQFTIDQLS